MNDQKSLQDELSKIEAAIQAQEALHSQGILPEGDIEATIGALQEKRQIILARLEGADASAQIESGGGALIQEGVDTGGGSFIGRDSIKFEGDVYLGPQRSFTSWFHSMPGTLIRYPAGIRQPDT